MNVWINDVTFQGEIQRVQRRERKEKKQTIKRTHHRKEIKKNIGKNLWSRRRRLRVLKLVEKSSYCHYCTYSNGISLKLMRKICKNKRECANDKNFKQCQ